MVCHLCATRKNALGVSLVLQHWAAIFSMAKSGADHSRGENICKHLRFETNDPVVQGTGVDAQCDKPSVESQHFFLREAQTAQN